MRWMLKCVWICWSIDHCQIDNVNPSISINCQSFSIDWRRSPCTAPLAWRSSSPAVNINQEVKSFIHLQRFHGVIIMFVKMKLLSLILHCMIFHPRIKVAALLWIFHIFNPLINMFLLLRDFLFCTRLSIDTFLHLLSPSQTWGNSFKILLE